MEHLAGAERHAGRDREKLNAAINGALQNKDVQQKLLQLGYIPGGKDNLAAVAAFVRNETAKWGELIRQAGIKAE